MVKRRKTDKQSAAKATASTEEPTPNHLSNLSSPKLTALICLSLAITQLMDFSSVISQGASTSFCEKFFISVADATDNEEEIECTESDLIILKLRYESILLRISASLLMTLFCWTDSALLQSWNLLYGIVPISMTISGYVYLKDTLKGADLYSMIALLVLSAMNRKGAQSPLWPIKIMDGVYNWVLMGLSMTMMHVVTHHAAQGGLLSKTTIVDDENLTEGGKAVWLMMVLVDYGFAMGVFTFVLLFFDEVRKRVS